MCYVNFNIRYITEWSCEPVVHVMVSTYYVSWEMDTSGGTVRFHVPTLQVSHWKKDKVSVMCTYQPLMWENSCVSHCNEICVSIKKRDGNKLFPWFPLHASCKMLHCSGNNTLYFETTRFPSTITVTSCKEQTDSRMSLRIATTILGKMIVHTN